MEALFVNWHPVVIADLPRADVHPATAGLALFRSTGGQRDRPHNRQDQRRSEHDDEKLKNAHGRILSAKD